MNSRTSNSTAPKSIPLGDTIRSVTSGVTEIDAFRATAYGVLLTVRGVKDQQLSREQKLLEIEYGPNDPRVAAVKSKLGINQAIRTDLTVAQIQAATPRPAVDSSSYVFHGFIRNLQRQARPSLTVALYDANGSWVRELGYSCTDQNGYFLLRFAQPSSGVKAAGAALGSLEVRVYDSQQKLLYSDQTPLTPKLGNVDYRLIILGDSADGWCPPPPSSGSAPPVTSDSAKGQFKNVASTANVPDTSATPGSAEPGAKGVAVSLPAAQPASASPSTQLAAMLPSQQIATGPTALISRFITENYPRIEHGLTSGPVTKSTFLQHYGNLTAENGDTVNNLLASLPADSVFTSVDAIPDALAQREAQTLQASSSVAAILVQVFGTTTPVGPISGVTVDKFVAMPANVRNSLPAAGIKTLADLAGATSAALSRVATRLKQSNVTTSLGNLAQFAGQAKVLVRLQ
jgi:hypothetical protein